MPDESTTWGLPVQPDTVPDILARAKRWCVWVAIEKPNGGFDKVPHLVREHGNLTAARVNRPRDGVPLHLAVQHLDTHPALCGVGFMLTKSPIAVLDFDKCLDTRGRLIEGKEWIATLLDELQAWVELSPSGVGLHGWVKTSPEVVGWKNHAQGVELLTDGFVTCTGQPWGETRGLPTHGAEELAVLLAPWAKGTRERFDLGPRPDVASVECTGDALALLDTVARELAAAPDVQPGLDRSATVQTLTLGLLRRGLSPVDAFRALAGTPGVMQVALDHRRQREPQALDYLWGHVCDAAAKGGAEPVEWEVLDDVEPESEEGGDTRDAPALFRQAAELGEQAQAPEWLVPGVVERGQMGLFVGPPGVGKSFLALDLAHALASHRTHWFTLEVPREPVLYIAAEARRGTHRRLQALLQAKGPAEGLYVTTTALGLSLEDEKADLHAVLDAARQVRGALGRWPKLLVVDTYSRAMSSIEENDPTAQAVALRNLQRKLADRGLAVLFVHHPNKADARAGDIDSMSPRGASSIEANQDFTVSLAHDEAHGWVRWKATRVKDAPVGASGVYRLGACAMSVVVEEVFQDEVNEVVDDVGRRERELLLQAVERAIDEAGGQDVRWHPVWERQRETLGLGQPEVRARLDALAEEGVLLVDMRPRGGRGENRHAIMPHYSMGEELLR